MKGQLATPEAAGRERLKWVDQRPLTLSPSFLRGMMATEGAMGRLAAKGQSMH